MKMAVYENGLQKASGQKKKTNQNIILSNLPTFFFFFGNLKPQKTPAQCVICSTSRSNSNNNNNSSESGAPCGSRREFQLSHTLKRITTLKGKFKRRPPLPRIKNKTDIFSMGKKKTASIFCSPVPSVKTNRGGNEFGPRVTFGPFVCRGGAKKNKKINIADRVVSYCAPVASPRPLLIPGLIRPRGWNVV